MTNVFIGIGRLARAAEMKVTPSGTSIANFTIAVNRMKKDDPADFINCICFNKQAENLVNFTDKGSQVAVEGRLQVRSYEDRDGNKKWVTEIVANRVQFLDSKGSDKNQSGNQQGNQKPSHQDAYKPPTDDPFNSNDSYDLPEDGLPF